MDFTRKIITLVALVLLAIVTHAQKYIDSRNVVWSVDKPTEHVSADNSGFSIDIDSIRIQIKPSFTGLLDVTLINNGSDRLLLVWDESTINSDHIVFGDMRKFEIGTPIKPSIVESSDVVIKSLTSEMCARNGIPLADIKGDKDVLKRLGYLLYPISLNFCIESGGKKSLIKISLTGVYTNKKFKNSKEINESQDFTEIDKLLQNARGKQH